MKKTIAMATLALAVSFGSISCKKEVTDAELQTQATTIVTSNPSASVEVKDGTAHLSGTFADQQSKDTMIASLKAVPGVKDVMDMATIEAPVVVETVSAVDPAVQQSVADAVKDFPSVKVEVINGELTLTGNVSTEQAKKIKMSVDGLKAGKVNYNYTVK
ncbi:BON domain-containing protein [Kaistella antarctica]|uniref:Periplasmic protein n=1 Tax=Kaistella antarctica TaxID=266748 RepID=A0A448NS26_9FLAO|nr:BON domain-containing protein [Kaistella antarctica]KEY18619.1 transporter [Kaistella antarctica]SEW17397.1 hyperosmotically inducible protein [Kaistella antarctica]VEH99797.1 periplasmic protein [Kaistella antarctica]